jgi:preprotein translocase subunit SecD
MTLSLRLQFIAILVLTALAIYVVAPIPNKPAFLAGFRINPGIDLAGGAQLRYTVLFEPGFPGARRQALQETADVLRRRIDPHQLREPKVSSAGDDGIAVQLSGIDADELRDLKKRIATMGKLQLFAAAPTDLQEKHRRTHVVPAGYRLVEDLLVEESPVIEGRHIVHAEPRLGEGGRWGTSFELNAEGAKLFDEAAERLYRQVPRGRIVIVLDDKVQSAPSVESPAFHGRGQISGARK